MKTAAKVFIWFGMIFGFYMIYPIIVGIFALKKIARHSSKDELQRFGIITLFFCSILGGLFMMSINESNADNANSQPIEANNLCDNVNEKSNTTDKTKKVKRHSSKTSWYLIVASVFVLVAIGMAMSVGIGFMTQVYYAKDPIELAGFVATIFSVIATAAELVALILGIISIINNRFTLPVSIMYYVCGIILLSCAFVPIDHSNGIVYLALTIPAGIITILAGTAYLMKWTLSCIKKTACEHVETGTAESKFSVKQLKTLNKVYKSGLLTDEEFQSKKELILCNANTVSDQKAHASFKKRYLLASIILSAFTAFYCLTAVPIISAAYQSKVYNYVLSVAKNYQGESLDYYFDYLPSHYKNTYELSNQYAQIENPYYLTRNKYATLTKIQDENPQWDFSNILREWDLTAFTGVRWLSDKRVLVTEGEAGSTQITSWVQAYIEIDHNEKLFTNLPNDMKSNNSYYYYIENSYTNPIIIGYENKNNVSDKFKAFRITNLKFNKTTNIFSITVFCYSNSSSYDFTCTYDW